MPWESENEEVGADRDWSKAIWYGIAALVTVMVILLLVPKGDRTMHSRARVWHILVRYDFTVPGQREAALQTINSLRERIVEGESFAKLAKEYSGDVSSAARGGDLGWVAHDDLDANFEAIIWTYPLNEITEVVETPHGLHLILVSEREIDDAEKYERELHERVLETFPEGAER